MSPFPAVVPAGQRHPPKNGYAPLVAQKLDR